MRALAEATDGNALAAVGRMIKTIPFSEQVRRTRIICTIGPACRARDTLEELIRAGMDVARLHFSYGTHREHAENIKRIRDAATAVGREVGILQDLSGTKVRMINVAGRGIFLKKGADFTLVAEPIAGSAERVAMNIPELLAEIVPGDTVLVADGALQLRVVQADRREARCEIQVGGRIKSGQAVLVVGKSAAVSVPTAKDLDDLWFGIRAGVNWIAQSFASTAAEIEVVRAFIKKSGACIPVMAKIERPEALAHLDELIQAADAIMVARGDLGLTTPIEEIAFTQKDIIRRARAAGKPTITATEMLWSMMKQPRPTRAEVADITNAILDGSDGLMLSGETAMGNYPVEAAKTMACIAAVADAHQTRRARGLS